MEARIEAILRELDEEGGIVRAVAEGRVQAAVSRQAYERERRLAAGEIAKVGVNRFVEEEEQPEVELHPHREEEARRQIERLNGVRAERDGAAVSAALEQLRAAAAARRNVMPAALDAVEAYATVGEVCGALVDVLGKWREPVRF
jgi:methylmalonyl-CoA mutase N-terminal domain/subunit